jgi:pimeloyl-ACP methyl ester carboxylesterase
LFLPAELAAALAGAERCVSSHQGAQTVWHAWGDASQPVVVLLHGGSGSWTHWVRNVAPLRDAGWRVLAADLPGFGDSELPARCTDVIDLPEHLHAGLQQLQAAGVCAAASAVLGFSFGGMAGALQSARHAPKRKTQHGARGGADTCCLQLLQTRVQVFGQVDHIGAPRRQLRIAKARQIGCQNPPAGIAQRGDIAHPMGPAATAAMQQDHHWLRCIPPGMPHRLCALVA